jgi:hypothetical protein
MKIIKELYIYIYIFEIYENPFLSLLKIFILLKLAIT